MAPTPTELLNYVSDNLGSLLPHVTFLGGSVVGLLAIDNGGRIPRTTEDVDLAIEFSTYADGVQINDKLLELGFRNDINGPVSRYLHGDVKIDMILVNQDDFGKVNNWYPLALKTSKPYTLPNGISINLITAECFIGTKLVAFNADDRENHGDVLTSRDFGDIVTVIDGRPNIVRELLEAPEDLKSYVCEKFKEIFAKDYFIVALEDHVDPGRESLVVDKMEEFVSSCSPSR